MNLINAMRLVFACLMISVAIPDCYADEFIEITFSRSESASGILLRLEIPDATPQSRCYFYCIGTSLDWISLDQIIELFMHCDSLAPCEQPLNALGAYRSEGYSTRGVEARRIIYGYIKGIYPPADINPPSANELRKLLLDKVEKSITEQMESRKAGKVSLMNNLPDAASDQTGKE